jgi:hypothetical protein
VEDTSSFLAKFGGRMPKALLEQAKRVKAELRKARAFFVQVLTVVGCAP